MGDALGDDERGDLVEIDTAIGFRNVGAKQAKLAALPDQLPRNRPFLLLQAVVGGHHFVVDELRGGLLNQPMLLGELFGRHHRRRISRIDQPRATLHCRLACCRCHKVS